MAVAVAGVTKTYQSCPIASPLRRLPPRCRLPPPPRASEEVEVRLCTNRTCARQGGREVLAALAGLAPPRVDVDSCGCLGRCGTGPNVAVCVPRKGAARFGHVGTAARGAQLLEHLLGAAEFDTTVGLAVLAAKEKAETALEKENAAEAEALLTEDAVEAIIIAPKFTQAHLLRGDALFAMSECCLAEDAYADALNLDPSIRRSKSFTARVERLREKLVCASSSP